MWLGILANPNCKAAELLAHRGVDASEAREELLARIIRLEEELYYLQREFKQCRGDEVEEGTEISDELEIEVSHK